jgi:hypothetical protein
MNCTLQGKDNVMFVKYLQESWDCYVEITQKQRMPKQVVRAPVEVIRRREDTQKREIDAVELDLRFIRMKYTNSNKRDRQEKVGYNGN